MLVLVTRRLDAECGEILKQYAGRFAAADEYAGTLGGFGCA